MSNFNLISASYQILPTGTTYNTPNATHVFTTTGTYNVIMTITAFDILSGLNCTRSTSRTLYVNPSMCGCFKASNLATAVNKVVNFTNTSNCVDTNTKYLYKFGNGDTSTNANPTTPIHCQVYIEPLCISREF
jgi:PKD repeat protein